MAAGRTYAFAAVFAVVGVLVVWLALRGGDGEKPPGADTSDAPADQPASKTSSVELPRIVASPDRHRTARDNPGTIAGTVREWVSGEPVAEVDVLVTGSGVEHTVTSDAAGRFTVELPPGPYALRAVGLDAVGFGISYLAVSPDAASTEVEVLVAILARIEGRVVDAEGAPIEGVDITHVTAQWERTLTTDDTAPAGEARTQADGAFAIRVPPGTVELTASIAGRPHAVAVVRDVRPDASIVGVEIVLGEGTTIDGKVHDPDGAPVAGALVVAIEPYGARRETRTDEKGRFVLEALPRGATLVEASARGFAPSLPARVMIGTVKPPRTVLVLRAPQTIAGSVVASDGTPIAGATITATDPRSELPAASATSGADGAFALDEVGTGPYDVAAEAEGFAPGRSTGVAGGATELRLELQASGGISGTVTSGGSPLVDFTVRIGGYTPRGGSRIFGGQKLTRFASVDGVYQMDELEPGSYDLTISAPGYAPAELRGVVVPAGTYGNASADLGAGGTIAGTVTDAETGSPIEGAIVTMSTGFEGTIRYTAADGTYRIDSVAPGRRSIEVRHPRYDIFMQTGVEVTAGATATSDIALAPLRPDGKQRLEFAGISAALKLEGGVLVVVGVGQGGPAERAGIAEGDVITAIDGKPVASRTFGDNIEAIRGVVGTIVVLSMTRGTNDFVLEVMRDKVRSPPGGP